MITFQETLAQRINSNPEFKKDVGDLLNYYFANSLQDLATDKPNITVTQIKRIAESALVMASSPNDLHQKTAFELASLLLESPLEEFPGLNGVMKIVCSRLGNIPTIDLLTEELTTLPFVLHIESEAAVANSTFPIRNQALRLTKFQQNSFSLLFDGYSVSLSAPTSAGKSFLVTQFIANQLSSLPHYSAVMVVPTRALIRQFTNDFHSVFKTFGLSVSSPNGNRVELITSSVESEEAIPKDKQLFILTQERLQSVLYNWKVPPHFDLVVVDESQKISDSKRGIILEDAILELVSDNNDNTQFIFLSPLSSNPDFLLKLLDSSTKVNSINSLVSPVAQHIYSVYTKRGNRREIFIEKVNNDSGSFIFSLKSNISMPDTIANRLAFLANLLGSDSSNILYASGPSLAEKTALALVENLSDNVIISSEVQETIDFISDVIHEEYYLVECLRKSVGYHYGFMPDIARNSVEDLFRSGLISNVACTSTLLEGVNLPAKNIFIDNPKLGNEPMDDSSFWNLAGRAGRLMKDFSGNVFCIYPDKWEKPISERIKYYDIKSSLNETLNNQHFIQYIQEIGAQLDIESFEQAVNNLVLRLLEEGEKSVRDFLSGRVNAGKINEIIQSLNLLTQTINIPPSILKKNKSIDVRLQQTFLNTLGNLDIERLLILIPRHPFSPGSYEVLQNIFSNTEQYFVHTNRGERYKYHTLIASKWIRENSLKEMIQDALQFERQKNNKPNVNKIIRDLVKTLNDEIRFHYVKNTKCFCDLLQWELQNRGISEEDYPSYADFYLPNYLELGMANPGTINLHNLGLSRTASIVVSNVCNRYGVSPDNTVNWVKERLSDVASLVPRPVRVELVRIFSY